MTAASETGRGRRRDARRAIPPSVVLVLVGLAISLVGPNLSLPISPHLILAIVLPGLVFEAAFRTTLEVLRPAAAGVLLLAIPGVVVVAAIVAVVLAATTGLSLEEAFVVGAMVAATDPAAVLSTFRRVAVPHRLATTVEMESLVNDGTGIVLFAVALEMLTGGGSAGGAAVQFVVSIIASSGLGLVLGRAMAGLVGHVHHHITELALTGLLAYGAYLAADAVGFSGVIATLAAATVFGATGRGSLTKRTIETIDVVWEWVALLLTAAVFLLVGLSIAPQSLIHAAGPIAWGVVAILLGRAVVVYLLLGGASQLVAWIGGWRTESNASSGSRRNPIPLPWLHVLFWAGLRGAVSVALALSLPTDLPNRDLLQGITFGIVLFTLLVQGTTATWVVRRSGASVATA